MKKFFSIAIMCVSLSAITMVSMGASANSPFSNTVSDNDLGNTVASRIAAVDDNRGEIKIDVYRTANVCNSYVAYLAGTTTKGMEVLNNPDYNNSGNYRIRIHRYYISYGGKRYYFNL